MTKEEDKEEGNLTVTLNYLHLAQDIKSAMHFLKQIQDKLEIAAIEKGMVARERRNGERRNGE